jgi:hypothetical protein
MSYAREYEARRDLERMRQGCNDWPSYVLELQERLIAALMAEGAALEDHESELAEAKDDAEREYDKGAEHAREELYDLVGVKDDRELQDLVYEAREARRAAR